MYDSLGSRDVHDTVDNERRALDRSPYTVLDFSRMESPSDFERLNIRLVNLFQRGVTLASSISPNADPICIGFFRGLPIGYRGDETE